jgi:hypothetical protein
MTKPRCRREKSAAPGGRRAFWETHASEPGAAQDSHEEAIDSPMKAKPPQNPRFGIRGKSMTAAKSTTCRFTEGSQLEQLNRGPVALPDHLPVFGIPGRGLL